MEIKKYFYSEYKKYMDQFLKEAKEQRAHQKAQCPDASEPEKIQMQQERLDKLLRELCFGEETQNQESYLMLLPDKFFKFEELTGIAVKLAQAMPANLWIYTENLKGCIIFAYEDATCTDEYKKMLSCLVQQADEVHLAVSADSGGGGPIDIDGLAEMEFWFDFYAER